MLKLPKVIIFDWDNTLVDTWPVIHEALHNTFVAMGQKPWTLEMVKQRVARSMRDAFPEVFGPNWEEAAKIYQKAYQSIQLEKIKPLPGASETLDYLASKGLKACIVSNKRGVNLRKEVTHLGWDKHFFALVGSDDAAKDKPSREPVEFALKPLGITSGPDCWFIGDSVIDLQCAKNTNCSAIFFGNAHTVDKAADGTLSSEGNPVMVQVKDHSQLLPYFAKLYA